MDHRLGTAPLTTVLSPRVVGRDSELAYLRGLLETATAGNGTMLFLVGEAGIGKSRLAATIAEDAARRGVPVLRGRAVQAATPAPYRAVAEALCSAVRVGATDASDLGPYREPLGRLVPEWRTSTPLSVDDSVVAIAEAVLRFLRVTAGRNGCLVVLEDLHWSDPETVRIGEYLADNLSTERVMCIATLRDEQPSAALDLARDLHSRRVSQVLRLSRLGGREVREMVTSCLNSETVGDDVVEFAARAGGVPFLIEELLAAGVRSGALVAGSHTWEVSQAAAPVVPPTFSESVRRTLAALGAQPREILLAAAVLGRRFDWSLLPTITNRTEAEVLDALRDAIDAQLVATDAAEPTFRFRHALSRDAVMAQLLPPEAAALARRALDAVEAAHPELEDTWCELAAELAERAGERPRAAALLVAVASRALERGALASAEATLEHAWELTRDDDAAAADVAETLTHVLSLAGKRDRSRDVAEWLLARLGDDDASARRRTELYLRLARAALAATRWDESHDLVERARAQLAAVPDKRLTARVDAVGAQAAIMRDPRSARSLATAALAAAEAVELHDVACEALEVLGRCERPHNLDAAEALFARALAIAEANDLPLSRARALHELGTIDMLRGRPVTRLETARELAVKQGALATAAVVDVQIAAAFAFRNDPEPGAVAARRCAELARRYQLHQTLAAALALECYVHARARRRDELQQCADEARAHATGVADVEVKIAAASAILAFVEEDRAGARLHLEDANRLATSGPGGDHAASPGGGMLALVRALEGTYETPAADLTRGPVHFVAAAFHRYASAVATGATEPDEALRLVAEADDRLGDHDWMRQLARRLIAEAALADGWGDPIAWLRESLAYFEAREEDRIASACRSLLRRAGAPVPRRRGDQTVPTDLRRVGVTSREFEVLRLLALGLTNKQIAVRLYLSPRTVERHIANLTVKTGVERRAELVAHAARTLAGTDTR